MEEIKRKDLNTTKAGKLTQAEEQKMIEYELMVFRRKLTKLNRELNYYQVNEVEIDYSEKVMSPVTLWWQYVRKFINWRNKNGQSHNGNGSKA